MKKYASLLGAAACQFGNANSGTITEVEQVSSKITAGQCTDPINNPWHQARRKIPVGIPTFFSFILLIHEGSHREVYHIQHPLIHSLMTYDTQYNNREIEYIEHNYSSDASSL